MRTTLSFQHDVFPDETIRGLVVIAATEAAAFEAASRIQERLSDLSLNNAVDVTVRADLPAGRVELQLKPELAEQWSPHRDTTRLSKTLGLDSENNCDDLEREIWLSLLQCPVLLDFPSADELLASVRMRRRVVDAARRTALTFATNCAERPPDYWDYDEDAGFIVKRGKPLIEALELATQPEKSGTLYSFSCYRATEYVMALAIAQEAAVVNQELLRRLQRQAEIRAIRSGEFHRVFCREVGSRDAPLPMQYFVPGDRTWFRNPDMASSDASGFEGSWVFYLGDDRFSNFWRRGKVFSLKTKCVEIYHWRHGTYRDEAGDLRMNEAIVDERVAATLADPTLCEQVFARMLRISDGPGIYAEGGCIDISRESPRGVCPGTSDILLPDAAE